MIGTPGWVAFFFSRKGKQEDFFFFRCLCRGKERTPSFGILGPPALRCKPILMTRSSVLLFMRQSMAELLLVRIPQMLHPFPRAFHRELHPGAFYTLHNKGARIQLATSPVSGRDVRGALVALQYTKPGARPGRDWTTPCIIRLKGNQYRMEGRVHGTLKITSGYRRSCHILC